MYDAGLLLVVDASDSGNLRIIDGGLSRSRGRSIADQSYAAVADSHQASLFVA